MNLVQKNCIETIFVTLIMIFSAVFVFIPYAVKADSTDEKTCSPVAIIIGPTEWGKGVPCSFDGSKSYSINGEIVEYEWQFCNYCEFESTGDNPVVTKTFLSEGTWEITLRVTDNNGKTDTDTHILKVTENGPTSVQPVENQGCYIPITIQKKVWDGYDWVEYAEYSLGDIVRFKVEIYNPNSMYKVHWSGSIYDQLPDNLIYINESSSILPDAGEDVYWANNLVRWKPPEVIPPLESLIFTFDTIAVGCGFGTNNVTASPEAMIPVIDISSAESKKPTNIIQNINGSLDISDTATVNIICDEPGLTIEKYVALDCTENYQRQVNAEIGDFVKFKIYVNNTGDIPLDVVVIDEMPMELIYNNHATPWEPNDTLYPLNGHIIYVWEYEKLQPYESFIITFQAIVDECGDFINSVYVTAESEGVEDNDSAIVHVECPSKQIIVNKTVWDGCTWSEYAEYNIGDIVRFKVEIYNPNSMYKVNWSGVVYDELPYNLIYIEGSADIFPEGGEGLEEIRWESNSVYWHRPPTILPLEKLTFTFNATAVECGEGENIVTASPEALVPINNGETIYNINNSLDVSDFATVNIICPPPSVPCLKYIPSVLDFGYMIECEQETLTFEIWNGCKGILEYSLNWDCGWITEVTPTSGTSAGENDTISVTISTNGLFWGETYICEIDITSNGGTGIVIVKVTIGNQPQPCLEYNPKSHDFGIMQTEQTDSTTFQIWNENTGTLTYTLTETCSWVELSQTSGDSTGTDDKDTITINIDTAGLTNGEHTCNIQINSNDGTGTFTVTINIQESGNPCLEYNPKSHDFGIMQTEQTDSTTFQIWNENTGTLTYTLTETCSWVELSQTSGDSTGTDDKDTITINIDTAGLTNGEHTCNIQINSNGGSDQIFTIKLNIQESGTQPPTVNITKPLEGMLYFRDNEVTEIIINLIIGPITIEAEANDADGEITKVEFYIDDELVNTSTDSEGPYTYTWNERIFGLRTITVKAYDKQGQTAEAEITVIIFNFGFTATTE